MKKRFKPLVCSDGFSVSIQANETQYCEPRNNTGPYTSVELGFPNMLEPRILPWAEDRDDPTGTVYGWVPADVVLEVIEAHGGWESGELPPMEYATWGGNSPEQ